MPKDTANTRQSLNDNASSDAANFEMRWEDASAECIMRNGQFVITEGSTARAKEASSLPDNLRSERRRLRKSGFLVPVVGSESSLRFTRDCAFGFASAAAGIVGANSLNGRLTWKVKGEGLWQERNSG